MAIGREPGEETFSGSHPFSTFEPRWIDLPLGQIFDRAFDNAEFDLCELSLSRLLRSLESDKSYYEPLPVFRHRAHRHACIHVARHRRIAPADLRGGVVGLYRPDQTAVVTARGILSDQYGVGPMDMTVVVPFGPSVSVALPDMQQSPPDRDLFGMLAVGELDAVFSLTGPPPDIAAAIVPMFERPDLEAAGFEAMFGFVPVMHMLGLRRALLADEPEERRRLITDIVIAFDKASQGRCGESAMSMERDLLALKAICRWAHEQGLISDAALFRSFAGLRGH